MRPSRRSTSSYSFSSSSTSSSSDDKSDEEDGGSVLSDTASDRMDDRKRRKRCKKRKKASTAIGRGAISDEQEMMSCADDRQNVLFKILHRERTGYFATGKVRSHQKPFSVVPSRLSFCLMEIVPVCYLSG